MTYGITPEEALESDLLKMSNDYKQLRSLLLRARVIRENLCNTYGLDEDEMAEWLHEMIGSTHHEERIIKSMLRGDTQEAC